ncbi:MAG: four helix bundle protein [Deltaproteobacteria bacterium]|jgi:four helix bundle protein|nr:four helix bundle protein [Deltaproteobacteria bacterium]
MENSISESDFVFPFEKIEVWHLSVDFADFVLGLLESFPPNKHFRVIGQMESAVSGISQNIAEGKGRQYNKEFIQFLYIAIGCLFEVLTLTEIFRRRKLFKKEDTIEIRKKAIIIYRKTTALIKSLKRRT